MNGRERMQAVLDGRPTDRIPHFEMVFAIPEEAFGLSWPTTEEMNDALGTDRFPAVAERYFHIWDLVLDTYDWDCVPIPHFTHDGELDCAMIRLARERYNDRAMVCTYNGDGTFWMPSGDKIMDFVAGRGRDDGVQHPPVRGPGGAPPGGGGTPGPLD